MAMPSAFYFTPANALAVRAIEAAVRGDPEYRAVLVCGPRGAGKRRLLAYARSLAAEAGVDVRIEPSVSLPVATTAPVPTITAIDAEDPEAGAIVHAFRAGGGCVVSLTPEPEILAAVAREVAGGLSLAVDPETLELLVDRLKTVDRIRGALERLQAEAVLAGRDAVDVLFALRILNDYLYPRATG